MSGDQDRDLQGEQAGTESGDEEVTTFELKKRSRTTMEEFRRKKAAGEKYEIKFDKEGVPIGTEEAVNKFASYCGYLARARVPITINDWWKDVSNETRLELWLDIKKMFNIEDDKAMNNTLKAMGINKIVIPGDSEGADSTSITIGDLEPRNQRYFMGRTVATKDKDTYTFHSSDSSTIEAFSRLSAMSGEINSGSIPEQEVLNRAVDRPEHPGRIRGYPLWTKKEDVYKRKSRKDAHEGWMAPDQIEELMSRVVAEAAEKTKRDLIHSEKIMNAARQQAFQEETPCDLFSLDHLNQKIKVAEGNIIPSVIGQIVHGVPLTDQQLYIHLLRVGDDFRQWQVPVRSDELLGNNIGGRFSWPSFLVEIGHKSLIKKKPDASKAVAKKMIESPKVPSAGSIVARDPLLEHDTIEKLTTSERELYELLMLQPELEKNFELHKCDVWGTHSGEVKFNVELCDILQCFRRESLNVSIVKLYSCFHWVLLVINVEKRTVQIADSIERKNPKILIKGFITQIYKRYLMENGKYNARTRTTFDWYKIQCPIQKGSTECGYFTMLAMKNVLSYWIGIQEIPHMIDPVGVPYNKEMIDVDSGTSKPPPSSTPLRSRSAPHRPCLSSLPSLPPPSLSVVPSHQPPHSTPPPHMNPCTSPLRLAARPSRSSVSSNVASLCSPDCVASTSPSLS
ncbi:Myb/SANT-like DNA-binding domain protein [Rhynchospora pubera]|uniref:Myb/SANT-like DNA-binding domain protein n=1 Tax=Rhynchospora pubera TaxID=906938 RepID=A0AAV8F7K1_9POAL|nr:Myb/SANT-like DNA-binding domain protein [Rhynchospora pubera]